MNQREASSKNYTQTEESKNFPEFKAKILKTWDDNFGSYPESERTYCLDDKLVNKFLIAREHKVPAALTMWKNWVEWRSIFAPHKITPQDVPNEHALRKIFWYGEDRKRHPLVMVKIVRSNPDADPKEVVRHGIYNLEKGIKEAEKRGTSAITCMVDMKGFSRKLMANKVTSTMKELLVLIQSYYPERLHKLYCINANLLFKILFTILKPFIDSKTRQKLVFISNHDELKRDFAPESLLKEYGGTADEPELSISEAETDYLSRQSQESSSPPKYKNNGIQKDGEIVITKNLEPSDKVELMQIYTERNLSPEVEQLVAEEKLTQLRLPYANLRLSNPFFTPR